MILMRCAKNESLLNVFPVIDYHLRYEIWMLHEAFTALRRKHRKGALRMNASE